MEDFNTEVLDLRPSKIGTEDINGNAYEYLTGKFASGAGKKGGEYYQNRLNEKGITRIIETYDNYQSVDKYSYVATIDQIKKNVKF